MNVLVALATVFAGLARSGANRSGDQSGGASHAGEVLGNDDHVVGSILRATGNVESGAQVLSSPQATAVRRALRSAYESAVANLHNSDLLVAVQELRDELSDEALNMLLADLITFALRDDRYEPGEARLISAIRKSWNVDPADAIKLASGEASADNRDRLWSILGGEGIAQSSWTPVHDLALVYLSVAHRSDGELSRTEVDAITRKLAEWLPSALPSDVLNVVDEALRRYADSQLAETLVQSVDRVVAAVPEHQRAVVIRDLMYVAEADNIVLVEEKQLISAIASRWGIDIA